MAIKYWDEEDYDAFEIRIKYHGADVRIKTQVRDFTDLINVFRSVSSALTFSDDLWKEAFKEAEKPIVEEFDTNL
jgi:hypothetical protein